MAMTNPSKRMKDHTAEFVIHIGNGFICDSVLMDKLACPYDFIHENDIEHWIIEQCQKHMGKDENACYKSFSVKVILDVEPFDGNIAAIKAIQKSIWEEFAKKKGKGRAPQLKRPTYGYMKGGRYVERRG